MAAELKLVGRKPTPEMMKKGCEAGLSTDVLLDDTRFACERAVWEAMFDAAPSLITDLEELADRIMAAVEIVHVVDGGYVDRQASKASILAVLTAALSASPVPDEAVREAVIEECAQIAEAIDSGRGNETEIAKAIRRLKTPAPQGEDGR